MKISRRRKVLWLIQSHRILYSYALHENIGLFSAIDNFCLLIMNGILAYLCQSATCSYWQPHQSCRNIGQTQKHGENTIKQKSWSKRRRHSSSDLFRPSLRAQYQLTARRAATLKKHFQNMKKKKKKFPQIFLEFSFCYAGC